jgi:hypothetical protein
MDSVVLTMNMNSVVILIWWIRASIQNKKKGVYIFLPTPLFAKKEWDFPADCYTRPIWLYSRILVSRIVIVRCNKSPWPWGQKTPETRPWNDIGRRMHRQRDKQGSEPPKKHLRRPIRLRVSLAVSRATQKVATFVSGRPCVHAAFILAYNVTMHST